jgi:polysaccharide deacetylase 2 family uncharacterized protein YibQ
MAASSMTEDNSFSGNTRRGGRLLALSYLFVFTALVALATGIALLGDPHAGDPIVRLDLRPAPKLRAAQAAPPENAAQSAVPSPDVSALFDQAVPPLPAPEPVSPGGVLVADPALIEKTPQGPLPRIADNGRQPMSAYAGPAVFDGKPRIAIVIGGLGISAKMTKAALAGLPAGVTLAFAPYAHDVQRWVTEARQRGHEVLLEIPMEPYDFPDSDPGRYTLRVGVGEDSNLQRLVWALTRFTGYTGATNLLGGRFLASGDTLEPVLTYLTRRGLLFYDNGSSVHSVAPEVAARVGTAFAQANDTIDAIQSAMEIDHRLSGLETTARTTGSASGSGRLYPVTIDRVGKWVQGLDGRGFALVPVSAIVFHKKQ